MRESAQTLLSTGRPSDARLAVLAQRHATKSTQNLRWLAAHATGWVREMWLAAIEVQRAAAPCAHDDLELQCPFCGRTVDDDLRVCEGCQQGVDPVRYCPDCEADDLGTLGDFEQAERDREKLAEAR